MIQLKDKDNAICHGRFFKIPENLQIIIPLAPKTYKEPVISKLENRWLR